jgi:hypothetical protein
MVFNATYNNSSVISLWSVLLVDETGVPVENHWYGVISIKIILYVSVHSELRSGEVYSIQH